MSDKNNTAKTLLRFSGLGVQLGLAIWLGNMLGKYVDTKFPNEGGWWEKGITLFVIFGSMYSIIRQVNKISQDQDKK